VLALGKGNPEHDRACGKAKPANRMTAAVREVAVVDAEGTTLRRGECDANLLAYYQKCWSVVEETGVYPFQGFFQGDNGCAMAMDGCTSAGGNEACRAFEWTPGPKDGGFNKEICFTATDMAAGQSVPESEMPGGRPAGHPFFLAGDCAQADETVHCVLVSVQRCVWGVQVEDTLQDIASRFDTNWLQLWHLNPSMPHPDFHLTEEHQGFPINVGHLYTAEYGDTLDELADRFGTSVGGLRDMNADISGSDIADGSTICITPDSCHTSTDRYDPRPMTMH